MTTGALIGSGLVLALVLGGLLFADVRAALFGPLLRKRGFEPLDIGPALRRGGPPTPHTPSPPPHRRITYVRP